MSGKTIGMLQPGYVPWLGFFEQIYRVDLFVILDDVQYTKGSWRNRHRIRTRRNWCWLTVPIYQKARFGQLIKDAEIDSTKNWAKKHWYCLRENYYHSEYWDFYSPFFKDIYTIKWHSLINFDMEILHFLIEVLGIKTKIIKASSLCLNEKYKKKYPKEGNATERNIFYLKELGADRFYEGAMGRDFLDQKRFEEADIQLIYQNYQHPTYTQRFEPFIPYLSTIDLLFNYGPKSLSVILNQNASAKIPKHI